MSTIAFFPCEGGSNLILGTGMENQIFILRTLATIIVSKYEFIWCKMFVSLDLDHPHPTPYQGPPHPLKIILMANIFKIK